MVDLKSTLSHPHDRSMTRHQRLQAALRGEWLDRVPVAAWMHFGSEHLSARNTAYLHARFQQTYDWDWVKVMADYHFELPDDVWSFDCLKKLEQIAKPSRFSLCFEQQSQCIVELKNELGLGVPLFDSGYSPYQMLLRHIGHDQSVYLLQHPHWTLDFLLALEDSICNHIADLKSLGITGYFHSTHAAVPIDQVGGMSDEVYERFVRPFDLKILQAAKGMIRILHAHGSGIDLDRLADYPFEVIHLADRERSNPDLSDLQHWTGACVMGGIDAGGFSKASRAGLAWQMDDAMAQTGGRRFMLAPGCVVSSSSSASSLHFLRRYSELGSSMKIR